MPHRSSSSERWPGIVRWCWESKLSLPAISTFWTNGGGARSTRTNCGSASALIWTGDTTGPRFTSCWSARGITREALYGLDCMPREDLRKIGARDRHAALKIAEIRQRHPNAVDFRSCLANRIWRRVICRARFAKKIPAAKVVTVLQNVDALYWRAAGEQADKVEAVRVKDDVLCVFNATPLEKYESYRLFLDQWSRCDDGPDFAPTIYNLIDSLASFLEINRYSSA